jgi:hypothetical protein
MLLMRGIAIVLILSSIDESRDPDGLAEVSQSWFESLHLLNFYDI